MTPPTVAVIGAGFAGTLAAAHLRALRPDLRVLLIERHPPAGPGVAYGTDDPAHLLNVPARHMSAWPDDPGHFARWLGDPDAFAERRQYGAYLREQVQGEVIQGEAIGLLPAGDRLAIRLADRSIVEADRVVLALGHFPPATPAGLPEDVTRAPWYVGEPWSPAAVAPVDGDVLLIGTGLTAVDLAISLLDRAGAGRVHLVSRRAQLPRPWEPYAEQPAWLDPQAAPTRVSQLLHLIKAEARRGDWRAVLASLPANDLWARLPLVEQRRFARHARPYWDAHRQKMPPATHARLKQLEAAGRLRVHAARIRALEAGKATLSTGDLAIARVVACTGPEANSRRLRHPLVQDVVGTGLGRPDPLYLGLDVTATGALIDEDGVPGSRIWAIGTLRKGKLLETAAVAELRGQARDVATAVVASLQP